MSDPEPRIGSAISASNLYFSTAIHTGIVVLLAATDRSLLGGGRSLSASFRSIHAFRANSSAQPISRWNPVVIEGRRACQGRLDVRSRYLEFPDGRHVDLPLD